MRLLFALLLATAVAWAQNPATAAFPATVPTDTTLPVANNNPATAKTLNGSISSGATTIVLSSGTGWAAPFIFKIGAEIIKCSTLTTATLTGCSRGQEGTAAAAHTSGAPVLPTITAAWANQVTAEIKAIADGLAGRKLDYSAGGGTAQAQTATPLPPVPSLQPGLEIWWLPAAANTALAPTLAVSGLTATIIKKAGNNDLAADDINTQAVAHVVYTTAGTPHWQLQNPQTASGGGGGTVTSVGVSKADDTNVTLTLGGTNPVTTSGTISLTLGWAGVLAAARLVNGGVFTGDAATTFPALTISAGAISLAKMANLAANSMICNNTGGAATPIACSIAQMQALIGTNFTLVTPTIASFVNAAHSHQNAAGGGTLAEAALALTDITTNNTGTSAHGFAPKGTVGTTQFWRQDWTLATPPGGGTPGGSDTQIQFNDSSAFGGDAGLVYNKTTDSLSLAGTFLDLSGNNGWALSAAGFGWYFRANNYLHWSNGNSWSDTVDVGLGRSLTVPDALEINNGSLGTLRDLSARAIILGGATNSCDGTAGCIQWDQGSAPSGLPANGIQEVAPASITSFRFLKTGAIGATGFRKITVSGTTATEGPAAALLAADIPLIPLNSGVTNILPGANGGTGNGFFAVAGPTTSLKTMTTPDANFTVARTDAANTFTGVQTFGTPVGVSSGGTGLAAGTSGGVLAYTAAGTIASSAALTANLPVIGGGAGVAPTVGTRSGNTTAFVTTTGSQTSGDCVKIDANGNHIANGSACGGGGGGVTMSAGKGHIWTMDYPQTAGVNAAGVTTPYYVEVIIRDTIPLKYSTIVSNAASGQYIAQALFDSSGNKVSGTDMNVQGVGSTAFISATIASPPTVTPGIYYYGWVGSSASANYFGYTYMYGAFFNTSPAGAKFFSGSSAATGSGATLTMPATIGTHTGSDLSVGVLIALLEP